MYFFRKTRERLLPSLILMLFFQKAWLESVTGVNVILKAVGFSPLIPMFSKYSTSNIRKQF